MSEEFQGWGTLELMGHRVIRGYIRGVEMYGKQLIKVQPLERRGADGELLLGEPQYYSPDSLYGLQPATSESALRDEVARWDPHVYRPQLAAGDDEADLVDDDHEIDDQLMDERDDDPEVHRAEDLQEEIDESDLAPADFESDDPIVYVIDYQAAIMTMDGLRGRGFYFRLLDYPDEGTAGPYATAEAAEVAVRQDEDGPVTFHYTPAAERARERAREATVDLEDDAPAERVTEPERFGYGEIVEGPSGAGASPRGAGETVDPPEDDGIPI